MISAALGLVPPFSWFLVGLVDPDSHLGKAIDYPVERVIRVIWPSSVWLMATDGAEGTRFAYEIIAMAVAANLILYALLGAVV